MKTTKESLLKIVTTMSVAINLVMLGGLGYLASVNTHNESIAAAMKSPVVVYIPKAVESLDAKTSTKPAVTQ